MTTIDDFDRKDHEIIKLIVKAPDLSQAKVADRLKIAVGTVNRRLKKLEKQGLLKTNALSRKKNRYSVTDKGLKILEKFAAESLRQTFLPFRQICDQFHVVISEWRKLAQTEANELVIYGEGDAAEICRLLAFEQGLNPVIRSTSSGKRTNPSIEVFGLEVRLVQEAPASQPNAKGAGRK